MNPLIETITRALADDAVVETRQAGAAASRTLLAALEAEPGKEIVLPGVQRQPPASLSGLSADQFFDVVIAKLKTLVDEKGARSGTKADGIARSLRIPMIVLPPGR